MRSYKIHFLRHGATLGNQEGLYIGVTDLKLTTNGINELKRLKNKGIYPNVPLVFSSPMTRALESAEIFYPEIKPYVIENFKETNFGEYEGKGMKELSSDPDFQAWVLGKTDRPKGGESFHEFAERLALGLREAVQVMMDKGVYEASAVMHGGAIMTLLAISALPRRQSLNEWACGYGKGFTVNITPSLYASSGIIEVIDIIDEE